MGWVSHTPHTKHSLPTQLHTRTHAQRMGSKKNKSKKPFAPSPPPSNNTTNDDNALVDDLLTELDSRDQSVRQGSATVLEEIRARQAAQASPPDKTGSKARFRARQVRQVRNDCSAMVTSLSSRQGKPIRSLTTRRLLIPMRTRSWSGRPKRRSARSIGYATSWG